MAACKWQEFILYIFCLRQKNFQQRFFSMKSSNMAGLGFLAFSVRDRIRFLYQSRLWPICEKYIFSRWHSRECSAGVLLYDPSKTSEPWQHEHIERAACFIPSHVIKRLKRYQVRILCVPMRTMTLQIIPKLILMGNASPRLPDAKLAFFLTRACVFFSLAKNNPHTSMFYRKCYGERINDCVFRILGKSPAFVESFQSDESNNVSSPNFHPNQK